MRYDGETLIPERGDPYEPLLARRFMSFEAFLDIGSDEERWELIGGLPALPERKTPGTRRLEGHVRRLLHETAPEAFDVWGPGALVRIDGRTGLIPSALVEPRPAKPTEILVCDPVLVVEVSYGQGRDRAILHDRRDAFLSERRTPGVTEYLAVIDSGLEADAAVTGHPGAMNFVSGAGRRYVPAERAQRVYRFDCDGGFARYTGSDPVPLASIGATVSASAFFPG